MTERTSIPDFEAAFYFADAVVQTDRGEITLQRHEVGNLVVTSGKIVACDAFVPSADVFVQTVSQGSYPVMVSIAEYAGVGSLVAAAMLRFSEKKPLIWDTANIVGRDQTTVDLFSYGVDLAAGCFADLEAMQILLGSEEAYARYAEAARNQLHNLWSYDVANVALSDGGLNIIAFSSGASDGTYPSYFGYDRHGDIACLATDFGIISELPYEEWPSKYQLKLEL